MKLQSLFSQLEKTRIIQTIISFYLVISLSIVNELKCAFTAAAHCIKQKTEDKYKSSLSDLPCGTNREQSVKD